MWFLNSGNSPELMGQLQRHWRVECPVEERTVSVGEGWRLIVASCHSALAADFPDYELLAIKHKWGQLSYQAFPVRSQEGRRSSREEFRHFDSIVGKFERLAESVCEWCGEPGLHRERPIWEVTLCDACDARFPDPPFPLAS
jgi:hypothetical protein